MKSLFSMLMCYWMATVASAQDSDLLIADFEGQNYGDWKVTGEAFGPGPARGTLPNQMHVEGFKGKGLVNSFFKGDGSVGTLTSPEFKIQRQYITFLIGGGKDFKKTCMHLIVDGKIVRTATGPNDKAGGTESLAPDLWDARDFMGKTATIQIVDNAKGGWGHINVDHILQSDKRLPLLIANQQRDFVAASRYLHLPVKNGAVKRKVTFLIEGKQEVVNDIELADDNPDWWAFMDISAWKGKKITIQVDKLLEDSRALQQIEQSDSIRDGEKIYREASRGQFHFSTRRGWINDPNGMVYFNGEYHLFYQHNPYGWGWGNMHWGHAVSKDMIHWEELGDTLAPDSFGPMFSGSAVVDWNNSSGLGKDGKAPLVLIYTAAGNPTVQCIAFSTDGRTFTKYAGNPVLKQISGGNRDPKVFWHAPTKKWVMVLYVAVEKLHTIHFFTSTNLIDWTFASATEGGKEGNGYLYECPDFFELTVDGDATKKKCVLMAANSEYAIGRFDGIKFTPEQTKLPGNRGRGFYAAQTFSDIPEKDGRRIQIGWFQTATPGQAFNQAMTIPLELKLKSTKDGPRITWTPIKELEKLRSQSFIGESITLTSESASPFSNWKSELVEIDAEFEPGDAITTFQVRGATINYDAKKQEIIVNQHRAPAPIMDGKQRIRIYCDRNGLEVFASDGLCYVPFPFIPKTDDLASSLKVSGGSVKFTKLNIHALKSTWK
jgi:fructan beta-fructosidase